MGTNLLKWRSEEGSEGPSLNSTIIALWKHTRNVGKRRQWPGNRGSELVGQGIGYFTTDTKNFCILQLAWSFWYTECKDYLQKKESFLEVTMQKDHQTTILIHGRSLMISCDSP